MWESVCVREGEREEREREREGERERRRERKGGRGGEGERERRREEKGEREKEQFDTTKARLTLHTATTSLRPLRKGKRTRARERET